MNRENIYRILFLMGIAFEVIGQLLLAQGNDFVYSLRPIDFAHWSLLLGVVLMIPQVVSFPKSIYSSIGIPMVIIGIACIIGMCVLDFIWWSLPGEAERIEFTRHISDVPSIWKPFIAIGPSSKIFNGGLFILALNYIKQQKVAVALIFLATLILLQIIPLPFRLVFGYSLTLIGFSIIFVKN